MNYAIIAAGEGSRLRKEGFKSVKPLVKVCGEYLIERLIRIFKDNDAEQISIIINEESEDLQQFLNSKDFGVKINLTVKSTPSSLHSFWNIIHNSNFEECCLTTVDTIFNERDFQQYISCFQQNKEYDALMGITGYIDDEKPLYVKTKENKVLAYLDRQEDESINTVSAGIYCLRKEALKVVDSTIEKGISRMRNYQRALLENNLNVQSFLFGKVIDIDHVEDIKKAEGLLNLWTEKQKTILALYRQKEFSPNSEDKDTLILNAVVEELKQKGYNVDCINETDFSEKDNGYSLVVSMARGEKTIKLLSSLEEKGTKVINSTLSIENCFREKQTETLQHNNISIPKTIIIDTDKYDIKDIKQFNEGSFWIKRADFQTIEEQDVCRPKSFEQAQAILLNYKERGIQKALISEHIEGDVIKFYGVRNTDFFSFSYPKEDKFHNKINISEDRISFNTPSFIKNVNKAINLLDLDIYGGDAVIDKQGQYYIIDINDFPSFSACRPQAATEITGIITTYLSNNQY